MSSMTGLLRLSANQKLSTEGELYSHCVSEDGQFCKLQRNLKLVPALSGVNWSEVGLCQLSQPEIGE